MPSSNLSPLIGWLNDKELYCSAATWKRTSYHAKRVLDKKDENSSAQQPVDDEDGVSEQPRPQEPAAAFNARPLRARRPPARLQDLT